MLRRNFLKNAFTVVSTIASTAAIGKQIITLNEINVRHEKSTDWIVDKGDYYLVNIPDGKTFAKEKLDKPSIIIVGENSKIDDIALIGYCNMFSKSTINATDILIDSTDYKCNSKRPSLLVDAPMLNMGTLTLKSPYPLIIGPNFLELDSPKFNYHSFF